MRFFIITTSLFYVMMKNQQDVPACDLLLRIKILLQFDCVLLPLTSRTLWSLREWPNAKMSVYQYVLLGLPSF